MSVFNDLLTNTQSPIEDLGFTWGQNAQAVTVLLKEQPVARETLEGPLPVIIVCPSATPERVEPGSTGGYVEVVYSVDVAVISPGEGDLATNIPTYLQWREQIRRAFQRVRFSAVPTMYMVEIEPGVVFDRQLARDNYDFLLLTIKYHSFEQAT